MQDRLVVRIIRLGGTAGSNVGTAACINVAVVSGSTKVR